jgi:hypothetical protein
MATSFECDPAVARQVSDQLSTVRADLAAGRLGATSAPTGSSRVDGALRDFFADSTASRESLEKLLERATGLLRGLSDGATAVDRGLAAALTPDSAPPPATASPAGALR